MKRRKDERAFGLLEVCWLYSLSSCEIDAGSATSWIVILVRIVVSTITIYIVMPDIRRSVLPKGLL